MTVKKTYLQYVLRSKFLPSIGKKSECFDEEKTIYLREETNVKLKVIKNN